MRARGFEVWPCTVHGRRWRAVFGGPDLRKVICGLLTLSPQRDVKHDLGEIEMVEKVLG